MWYWIYSNLSWLIPLLVSIIFSLLAITLSFRNTFKQNVASQRPYLTVNDLEETDKDMNGYLICVYKGKEENLSSSPYKIGCKLALKNIGYGVASTVKLMSITENISVNEVWNNFSNDANPKCLTIIDIASDDNEVINLTILDYSEGQGIDAMDLSIHLVLMYSDLYGTVYSSILILSINKIEGNISYTFYPMQTSHFRYVLAKLHIRERALVSRYIFNTRKRKN